MVSVNGELVTVRSEDSNTGSSYCSGLRDAQEAKQMLSLPAPRCLSLPAIFYFSLDKRCLPQVALPRGVRPS